MLKKVTIELVEKPRIGLIWKLTLTNAAGAESDHVFYSTLSEVFEYIKENFSDLIPVTMV